ncbi:phytanoyl-CoA dioxygenase, peroxisomal-like [Zerene cesonia]|uniref:phytanoyl-CoA dioxygenase, peroxisomal-like n=1 Tax=Zerene cesonia TaxID=33412 RepID=UPI0018E4EBE0|nr:phytanoyl-CoA dioxygenase, peroxisomal-like [Zerene cesonia]
MVRLTKAQIQFYKDNGYLHLKNLIKGRELERLSEEYDNLFQRKKDSALESSWVGTDGDREGKSELTVKGIHNLQMHHEVFARYLYNEDLLDALEDVMGTKNIVLHHTKAHTKPPEKGASYAMHQDYHYFRYEKHSMVAATLFLDASNEENGTLFVYPGSHKLGPLEDIGAKEGSDFHYLDQEKYPIEKATPVIADPGDVLIFSYFTIHGSPPNRSTQSRRILLVQVADADDRQVDGFPDKPCRGLVLRGVNKFKDANIFRRNQYD